VPDKMITHQAATKCWGTGSVCLWRVLIERQNSWN
jgi:hypothetical protein